ncbi:hypothetical protein OV079_51080 [Nannocystis pusilla]|uniref:Sigma-54 factor interaction domain-containing protein n=1 Tax=Nannocystis pusilla TaxID=889268 RepID=A0A9X3J3G0_9BACT|nr:hypothetical protein [Nannocystis pusilla]MCY1013736.1 hypothetical protein [Nannocystis pusilla]
MIERGVIRPIGGTRERRVNTRILAPPTSTSPRPCAPASSARTSIIASPWWCSDPALRDRREDIPLLVEQCLESARRRYPTAAPRRIGEDVMAAFLAYRWPGNVRELCHLVERLVLLSRNEVIALSDLPRGFGSEGPDAARAVRGRSATRCCRFGRSSAVTRAGR